MKQFFSRSLVSFGHRRPCVPRIAALPLALGLLLVFLSISSPAFAATHTQATSNRAATQTSSLSHMPPFAVTVTDLGASHNSAGNSCDDRQIRLGSIFVWIAMETYWCWNNVIVTYHSTIISGGITTAGHAYLFIANGPQAYAFNCYNITSTNCSGNHEWTQQLYLSIPLVQLDTFAISEEEGYRGQFSYQTSSDVSHP